MLPTLFRLKYGENSRCQVQWTRALVWLPWSLVSDLEHEKLDFAQYLTLPFQILTGPQKRVHGFTFACCQTLTCQFPLLSLGHPAWSYRLRSSWSRYCRFCLIKSRWFEVIIQLTESVFGWICQWTTRRCCITIVRVESWRLQRKIQPRLIYAFCSYLLDIPRRTCQECFAFLLKPSACYMHIPAEMRASGHQITLPTPILHLMSSTTWLTRSLGGKLPRRIYHVGLLLCRRWFSFNHHQLLQSGFFLCWSPCLGTSSMRALRIILRQPSCYV